MGGEEEEEEVWVKGGGWNLAARWERLDGVGLGAVGWVGSEVWEVRGGVGGEGASADWRRRIRSWIEDKIGRAHV